MKFVVFLVFAAVAPAQIAATISGNGIKIQNSGSIPFTALAVSVQRQGQETPQLIYLDELTDESAPKQTLELLPPYTVPRNSKASVPPILEPLVIAAIFSDGSTTGDSDLIRRLILRRCNMLQAAETALEMIADAGRHNVSRARLIADFKRMAVSVKRWYLPPEQRVGASVYQTMAGKLINLSEGELGAPFPPAEFVQRESARLNRQRAILMSSQPSLADAGGYTRENANRRP